MSTTLNTPVFGPLSGVRVIMSAIEIAVPFSAQLWAEWGAEVIWIENVAYADTIRLQRNYSQLSRRNLHNLSLNLFSEEGKQVFLQLVETADILIESSKGPAFARRGLTDELLWQHNKKLVIAHLSGYGQTGDENYVNRASYDLISQAFSGYLIQNGDVNQPTPAFPYAGDYFSGFMVAGSVLAALHKAKETGVGESIDVSMYETVLRVGQYYMMDYFNEGKTYPRSTRGKDPSFVGCGIYTCSDGFIAIEWVGGKQIENLLTAIGMRHILGSEEYPEGTQLIATASAYGQQLEDKLDAYFSQRTVEEALAAMVEMTLACEKVLTIPELEKNPQYIARQSLIEWQDIDGKQVRGPNVAPRFTNNPCHVWRGRPERGQDTAKVLSGLGYSGADIQTLSEKGVIKVSG